MQWTPSHIQCMPSHMQWDTLIYVQCTPTYTHTSSHTPSHILTTLTFSHTTHLTYILTHNHIYPHTPTHPHTQHIQIDDQVLKEEDLLEIIVDHPLPDGLLYSCLSLSVSVTLSVCHSVCLSVCLSGIVSALHLYGGGSLSAGSCSRGVAGIMSAVATFQQSTPC